MVESGAGNGQMYWGQGIPEMDVDLQASELSLKISLNCNLSLDYSFIQNSCFLKHRVCCDEEMRKRLQASLRLCEGWGSNQNLLPPVCSLCQTFNALIIHVHLGFVKSSCHSQ